MNSMTLRRLQLSKIRSVPPCKNVRNVAHWEEPFRNSIVRHDFKNFTTKINHIVHASLISIKNLDYLYLYDVRFTFKILQSELFLLKQFSAKIFQHISITYSKMVEDIFLDSVTLCSARGLYVSFPPYQKILYKCESSERGTHNS